MGRVLIEICVDDSAGVRAASAGGADRIELCSALALGGLTPSPALAAMAVEAGLVVHAMVRPRGGDFVYAADEIGLMVKEIGTLAAMDVAGVVVGATHADGSPDRDSLGRLRDAAAGVDIVLHRAIDLAPDPVAAVELACALGYDHVLSSGGALTAIEGAATLERMVDAAAGRLSIIAGSGVRPENAAALVHATGVHAVHSSAASDSDWEDGRIAAFGFGGARKRTTDPLNIKALRAAVGRD